MTILRIAASTPNAIGRQPTAAIVNRLSAQKAGFRLARTDLAAGPVAIGALMHDFSLPSQRRTKEAGNRRTESGTAPVFH